MWAKTIFYGKTKEATYIQNQKKKIEISMNIIRTAGLDLVHTLVIECKRDKI